MRPFVPVELIRTDHRFPASHPYVRRFWVAALGSGAVAELLRLVRAAEKGEEVRLPRHLPQLLKADLVSVTSAGLRVGNRVPPVPPEMRWRFPPSLAGEHARWARDRSTTGGEHPHGDEGDRLAGGEAGGDPQVGIR